MDTPVFFDSHAHYFDDRFEKYEGGAEAAIRDAFDLGIRYILNAGTTPETSRAAIRLAETHDGLYAAAGLHPSDSHEISDADLPSVLDEIRTLCTHEKIVALGEIGLDYYWDDSQKDRQKSILDVQLSMAEELDLPVIIHDREAHGDTMDILRAHPNVRGVLHSFSGSAEMARQLLKNGWYISFSGPITYKNARSLREVAASVPLDRILIETDAPYLPPEPHRGKINFSGYLPFTANAVADIKERPLEEIARQTTENAKALFGL
ncbi:MAG: TatD family hydrolase [Clostridia bacterium]|nr:TatD family hydrolase [Clostridia bacterium]